MPARLRAALAAAALVVLSHAPSSAQVGTRPHLEWRTVRTEHFDVHFPAELETWTRDVLSRLEPVHAAVSAVVGSAPRERVTIVVEDPAGASNGFAYSYLDGSGIVLWPTPPDPRSVLGNHRGAGEQLIVHEYAHVAHLTRPSRNPGARRGLRRLSPLPAGPLAQRAPRWVKEGYATYVEGRLTGAGRPFSAIRASVLRRWALEGRLPTYAQLDGAGGYQGGAMAYLAGSAFLEWLAARRGDESLVDLWRRMSARQVRTFADAFAGVYGGPPEELYGRFTVELTERSLEARRRLAAAGLREGTQVQRLAWSTGDPAISPDGESLAIVLRGAPGTPARVVVWKKDEEPEDSTARKRRERAERLDPEDVRAVEWRPRPRRALATLPPKDGRGHDAPRFLPGGAEILVVRSEPLGDGGYRPDLFVWTWKTGKLRRVTRGAGIRHADPAPDGRTAAAVRCLAGICDLVRVDLRTGETAVIAEGSPTRVWHRPRWSPDGRQVLASVQEGGVWRLALVDAAGGAPRRAGPDDGASRYDAAFLPGGGALVAVSERGGIANLERIDLATGAAVPLTRVLGGAVAAEVDPATGDAFFLSLRARGLDLMRVDADTAAGGAVVLLPQELAPAVARVPAARVDTLPRVPLPPERPYGVGPRRHRVIPVGTVEAGAATAGVAVHSVDPIGRLGWSVRGEAGSPALWRGAALSAAWRGTRPGVAGTMFWTRQRPTESAGMLAGGLDAEYAGAALWADAMRDEGGRTLRARLGASHGSLAVEAVDAVDRRVAFGELSVAAVRTRGGGGSTSTAVVLSPAVGATGGEAWTRLAGTLSAAAGTGRWALVGSAAYGRTRGGPAWEEFAVGGVESSLVDPVLLTQRVAFSAYPTGTLRGPRFAAGRGGVRASGLTLYLAAASAGETLDARVRAWGIETSVDGPALPLLRIPRLRVTAGAAYPLDAPVRHRIRAYASLSFGP